MSVNNKDRVRTLIEQVEADITRRVGIVQSLESAPYDNEIPHQLKEIGIQTIHLWKLRQNLKDISKERPKPDITELLENLRKASKLIDKEHYELVDLKKQVWAYIDERLDRWQAISTVLEDMIEELENGG